MMRGRLLSVQCARSLSAAPSRNPLASITVPPTATKLVDYLNKSWTQFHATTNAAASLSAAGWQELAETDQWTDLKPNGKYFFTRNHSAIVAFAVGGAYEPGAGFHIIAAHTDSPTFKLKPVSDRKMKGGFVGVNVQTYGGGLWYTWFDRDLSVAGRVLLREPDGSVVHRLVQIDRPIMRIPSLAIHLNASIRTDGFKPNEEKHLAPVLATAIKSELEGFEIDSDDEAPQMHHPLLLAVLAEELNCDTSDIADFELNVCDTQPSVIGGVAKEFVLSGRLDNLASSYCAVEALLASTADGGSLDSESGVRMVALFDNEECGSDSTAGAGSPMLFEALKRATKALSATHTDKGGEGLTERTIRRSFVVSADMAHALHPNYIDKHESNHQPKMHKGLVVKYNANQRYATNSVTSLLFRECAAVEKIPTQDFVVRQDMGCGSTLGPILAAGMGIRTVDVGIPQLAMHSVREMCGTEDIDICVKHFTAFYNNFTKVDEQMKV